MTTQEKEKMIIDYLKKEIDLCENFNEDTHDIYTVKYFEGYKAMAKNIANLMRI